MKIREVLSLEGFFLLLVLLTAFEIATFETTLVDYCFIASIIFGYAALTLIVWQLHKKTRTQPKTEKPAAST